MSQPGDPREVAASPSSPWSQPPSWADAQPPVPGTAPGPPPPSLHPPSSLHPPLRSDPPLAGTWRSPPPRPAGGEAGPAAVTMLAIVAAVTVLGAPYGFLWSVVAPGVPLRMTGAGPAYADAQPEQLAAADGWFALLALPFGMLVAVGVWLAARRVRGVPALVAVTAGAVGAGLFGWWVGRQLGLADYQQALAAAATGASLERPPDLAVVELGWWPPYVLGVLLVPALAAAVTYTLLAAWSRFPTLQPEDQLRAGDIAGFEAR